MICFVQMESKVKASDAETIMQGWLYIFIDLTSKIVLLCSTGDGTKNQCGHVRRL